MKQVFLSVLSMLFLTAPAFAWIESANGGQPGEYLAEMSGGARGLALGLAQVSLKGQSNLLYSNPASLSGLNWKEASFGFVPLYAQSQYAAVSFGAPMGGTDAIGVSLIRLTSGDAEKTNALGETLGSFSDSETAVIIGAARRINKQISLGAALKLVSQDIDTWAERGGGLDLGLIYRNSQEHIWGLCLQNAVAPALGVDTFPMILKGGSSHNVFIKDLMWHANLALVNLMNDKRLIRWYTGFEYNRPQWFFWRLGANEKQASAGFGVGTKQMDIDYAYIYSALDTLHTLSLNLRYGFPETEGEIKAEERIEEIRKEKEELVIAARKAADSIKFERERLRKERRLAVKFFEAQREFQNRKYESARDKLMDVLKDDPANEEAKKLFDEINARLSADNIKRRIKYAKDSYAKGAYSDTKGHANYVLDLQPDNREAYVIGFLAGAQIYVSNKEFKAAKGELIEVLKIEPNNEEAAQLLKRVQNILDAYGEQ